MRFPLQTLSTAHTLDFWVPTADPHSNSSFCLLSQLFPVTRGMSRRWSVPRQAGRTRDPSAVCWQLPVPLPWLSSRGGLRQGWAGRLSCRPSASSEPPSQQRDRVGALRADHTIVPYRRLLSPDSKAIELPELGAERVDVFSGEQGLNTEML